MSGKVLCPPGRSDVHGHKGRGFRAGPSRRRRAGSPRGSSAFRASRRHCHIPSGQLKEEILNASITVHALDVIAEGEWNWRDNGLRWRHRQYGSFGEFDPFPAYGHDVKVVEETAQIVVEKCPPLWNVELFVANREEIGRSNGYSNCHESGHYEGDEWVKDPPIGLVMMSGKRVPPHPAMSRYLTAHEYGHHVEWMLEHARGAKHVHEGKVMAEYAKYRGLPETALHHGSGGRWHDSATEVFACDFRIVVCNVETEYWPHPGIPHPRDLSLSADLWSWWVQALAELAAQANS